MNVIAYKDKAIIIGHPFWYETNGNNSEYKHMSEKLQNEGRKKIAYIDYVKIIENPSLVLSELND